MAEVTICGNITIKIECLYHSWKEQTEKQLSIHNGWCIGLIVGENECDYQWPIPNSNNIDENERMQAFLNAGGRYRCKTGDNQAFMVFETQEKGNAFIDDYVIPQLLADVLTGVFHGQ